ncbi:MAG: YigZ family protein, partial [Thermodesulfobacteriota bacterium]
HSSDAGEPSGTAGKPMLNTLQKYCMTNVAVVVTRYFGGVKLGVRGLIDAYCESVSRTIELKKLKKLVQTIKVCIEVSYEFNDTLQNQIQNFIVGTQKSDYSDKIVHMFEFEHKDFTKLNKLFSEYQSRGILKFSVIE